MSTTILQTSEVRAFGRKMCGWASRLDSLNDSVLDAVIEHEATWSDPQYQEYLEMMEALSNVLREIANLETMEGTYLIEKADELDEIASEQHGNVREGMGAVHQTKSKVQNIIRPGRRGSFIPSA